MKISTFLGLVLLFLSSCFIKDNTSNSENILNIYSARHYDVDKLVFENFEKETGIKINIITDDAEKLIARIEREGKNSPCDILLTTDASNLYKASSKQLLQPLDMENELAEVPTHLKNKFWVAFTKRARIIVYDPKTIPMDSVNSYEQLSSTFLKQKLVMRNSDNPYNRSLVSSIIIHNGTEFSTEWVKNMVNNFSQAPSGNDRDQVKLIAGNLGSVSVINTYYLSQMFSSTDESERLAVKKVAWVFPNQASQGTHINISGACIVNHSPNIANAKKFISYLVKEKNQMLFANLNKEFPVINDVILEDSLLNTWLKMKFDTLDLYKLGSANEKAMQIISSSGWK